MPLTVPLQGLDVSILEALQAVAAAGCLSFAGLRFVDNPLRLCHTDLLLQDDEHPRIRLASRSHTPSTLSAQ